MLKVIWNVIKKIFSIIMLILSPLKRLWCRRKRRNSDTLLPMSNHYPSVENLSSSSPNGTGQLQEDLAPWDSWEDQSNKINNVQQYRQHQQQLLQKQTSQEEERELDYFQDMTPAVKKQKRVLVKKRDDNINTNAISSKLAMSGVMPLSQSSELGTWDESNNAWEAEVEDDLSWEADNVIREKRRQERQQRQLQNQRRKQEREQHRHAKPQGHFSAVKLS